jgi:hypothetical protein
LANNWQIIKLLLSSFQPRSILLRLMPLGQVALNNCSRDQIPVVQEGLNYGAGKWLDLQALVVVFS